MANKRGVTLVELAVVAIIVGLMAVITLPAIFTSTEQTNAQTAKNNLLAIAAAQSKFFEDYSGAYCINSGANPSANVAGHTATCGDNAPDLNANLSLNFSASDPFYNGYYCCSPGNCPAALNCPAAGATAAAYCCTTTDHTDTLILTATTTGANVTCTPTGSNCPF